MKFFWIDLEMTGLDPEKEVIIEAAAVITENLEPIDNYHAIVKQPQSYLDKLDEWNLNQHTKSGLLEKIPHGKPPEEVEKELLALADKHFSEEDKILIAGNSVFHDKLFIQRGFPELAKRLHYRVLDVSSWKVIFEALYDKRYAKNNHHRAIDDIQESIEELKYYLKFLKEPLKKWAEVKFRKESKSQPRK